MPKSNLGAAIVLGGMALALTLFPIGPDPVLAQGVGRCDRNQESFSFEIKDHPIKHQVQALLNISVDYRFITTRPLEEKDYINFVPVAKEIKTFLATYPNDTDYWEVLNKNLVDSLLKQYPSIGSLRIQIQVSPTPSAAYFRRSTVLKTRSNNCPLL